MDTTNWFFQFTAQEIILQIVTTVIAVIIGGLVTFLVARWYYKKAAKELRAEAETLRQLNILLLRAMEEAGFAKFTRDKDGNPVGLIFERSLFDKVDVSENVVVKLSGDNT